MTSLSRTQSFPGSAMKIILILDLATKIIGRAPVYVIDPETVSLILIILAAGALDVHVLYPLVCQLGSSPKKFLHWK
jgi:hypothetical protein